MAKLTLEERTTLLDDFRRKIAQASPEEVRKTLGLRSPGSRDDVHAATVATLERIEQFTNSEAASLLADMFLSFETSNYFGDGHKREDKAQEQTHKERQELLLLIILKSIARPVWMTVLAPRIAFTLGFFFHREFVLQIVDVIEPHIDLDELLVCAGVASNMDLSEALLKHCAERRIYGLEKRRYVDIHACSWRINHPSRHDDYADMFVDDLIKTRTYGQDNRLGIALDAKLLDENAAIRVLQHALAMGTVEATPYEPHRHTKAVAQIIEELLEYRADLRSVRERLHATAAFSDDPAVQEAFVEENPVDVSVMWDMVSHHPAVVEEFIEPLLTIHNATVSSEKNPLLKLILTAARLDHYGWRQTLKTLVDHGLDLRGFNEKSLVLHAVARLVEKSSKDSPAKLVHIMAVLRHLVLDYGLDPFLKDGRSYTPQSYLGRAPAARDAWADLMRVVKARSASNSALDEIARDLGVETFAA